MATAQEYYSHHGPMSALGAWSAQLGGLPQEMPELCRTIQGLLIHRDLAAPLYKVNLSEEQRADTHIRPVAEMLARISAIDARAISVAREPARRLPAVCRHYSLMLCAILRERDIPARARCGFGAYFTPGRFEDHWVCEYWNAAHSRWILVDAQLDAEHRAAMKLDFDPLDVPHNRFIIAGDAWQLCRTRGANPDLFGLSSVPHLHGLWFIAGNVLRDLASLNRTELLPWDVWGLMEMSETLSEEKKVLIDRLAALTLAGDDSLSELRAAYESDERLRVPPVVFNALTNAQEKVLACSRRLGAW